MEMEAKLEFLKANIKSYQDFPKPGVIFMDVFSLLGNPETAKVLNAVLIEYVKNHFLGVEVIVGLESRGFLFGATLALELGLPFVPIRKKGKLPGELVDVTYGLEYGTDTFEIQKGSISPQQKVLVVDDLLATGGSLGAAFELIQKLNGHVLGGLVIMELVDLKGRDKIVLPIQSLIKLNF